MAKVQNSTNARRLHKLASNVLKTAKVGFHGDGGGLWLVISLTGAAKWEFRYSFRGRVRHRGLGSARDTSLAQARQKAAECRALLAEGRDPIDASKAGAAPRKTFGACAIELIQSKETGWRNDKHARQWGSTILQHCGPILNKPVDEIDTQDVLGVLQPIWQKIPETASRLRGRIEAVLDFSKARGWRSGENPAAWRGHLALILPKRSKLTRGHHAAMDYRDVPEFIAQLRECNTASAQRTQSVAAMALEFLILTAARSGEVLGARWGEFDLKTKVWTIPAARMKAGREHRVPLSARSLAILDSPDRGDHDLVFAGKRERPLSGAAMGALVLGATVHGFRSSFRDWAGEETSFPREIAEAALAHVSGNSTERAYRRSDALEKRRALMEAWAAFCEPAGQESNVLPMRALMGANHS